MQKTSFITIAARALSATAFTFIGAYASIAAMSNALPEGPSPYQAAALDRGEAVAFVRDDGATVWAFKDGEQVIYSPIAEGTSGG